MFNKFKIHSIKKSLNALEKNIFDYLCREERFNTVQRNKELAIEYASLPIVQEHNIGEIFKIEALRYTILNEHELDVFCKGMKIVDRFFELQKEIEKEGYKILCSSNTMKKLLLESNTLLKAEKALNILEKELSSLEQNIEKKKKEKYYSSNPKEIAISNLNKSQQESLTSLGFNEAEGKIITLANLKKLYNKKLYSINYDKPENTTDDYIKELSEAFFNVKKAFDISY